MGVLGFGLMELLLLGVLQHADKKLRASCVGPRPFEFGRKLRLRVRVGSSGPTTRVSRWLRNPSPACA